MAGGVSYAQGLTSVVFGMPCRMRHWGLACDTVSTARDSTMTATPEEAATDDD